MFSRRGAVVILLLLAVATPFLWRGMVASIAGSQLRRAAASRDLAVSWTSLRADLPARITLRGLELRRTPAADTLFRGDSLVVELEVSSLLTGRPRLGRIVAARAEARAPGRSSAEMDTLAPDLPAQEGAAAGRAERLKRSVASLARLLSSPARELPRLELHDVTLLSGREEDALLRGAHLGWLQVTRVRGRVRLSGAGTLLSRNELPFEITGSYGSDDRFSGALRLTMPDEQGGRGEPLLISARGALSQHGNAVRFANGTRVKIGEVPLEIAGEVDGSRPRIVLGVQASGLSDAMVRGSLPRGLLGALVNLGVDGTWDQRVLLDLDLSRPDSVQFDADVIPHGLRLDPERTQLRLLGLEEPFQAAIHLPGGRVVTRDLSEANPFYRPVLSISPHLTYAVLTNEDGGFFRHRGFNPGAIREAIAENVKAGSFRRGAGTITMQLARNLYLGHERTLSRKMQEVVLAWVLEHLTGLPKARILEIYLNVIEWGPDVHGAGEAARFYFGRDPADLTLDEALFLTILVPSPRKWRYRFSSDGSLRPFARAQMHFIGRAMVAKGWLDPNDLPPAELLRVELRGPAREILLPDEGRGWFPF